MHVYSGWHACSIGFGQTRLEPIWVEQIRFEHVRNQSMFFKSTRMGLNLIEYLALAQSKLIGYVRIILSVVDPFRFEQIRT